MVKPAQSISFVLNDQLVSTSLPSGMLVLDFLRKEQFLSGTKEGCKEGDCGACTVIIGELQADGHVAYTPMTSCLLPLGELSGKHLVTIEGLNMETLSPVQHAMVDCGGTQCGYCTPGFIVSMTAGLMEPGIPLNEEGLLYAISGNLCRCTGYRSIKEAGCNAIKEVSAKLTDGDRIEGLCKAGALPEYFLNIAARLSELSSDIHSAEAPDSEALFIAGGTDLYVQRGEKIPEIPISLLNQIEPVEAARIEDGSVVLDARMSFEAFANDPIIQSAIPDVAEYNLLISSWPVRTRATLGGNICNASPIADMTCLFMALESKLTLSNAGRIRELALSEFYLGYKKLNKTAEERLTTISFPLPDSSVRINWEKVSKRTWLDIATVNSAAKFTVVDGRVCSASLSLGGVAAVPLYLSQASDYLLGKTISNETIRDTLNIALSEFDPISDVRGSATYKKLLARQLLLAHFTKLFEDQIEVEAIYAAL